MTPRWPLTAKTGGEEWGMMVAGLGEVLVRHELAQFEPEAKPFHGLDPKPFQVNGKTN